LHRTRFGVVLLPYSVSFERILAAARKAEELGFDSVWVSDHLQRGSLPVLECWTTISALAATTKRIRLGSLATCNSFRNPGLLAKIVASASQVSKGRVDLGIGVGYDDIEHNALGYPFPKLSDRVAGLSESLKVMLALWRGSRVDFEGLHSHFMGAVCLPPPAGKPRVWVAGRSTAVLEAAGSSGAYGVNILPYSGTRDRRRISSPEEIEEVIQRIDSYTNLKKSMYCGDGGVLIAPTREEFSRRVGKAARRAACSKSEMQDRLRNLSALFGTVEECVAKEQALASVGFEELMLILPGWQEGDYANMTTFAQTFIG
jgi:alkanesulfonate monooxygenase SsuD/methylene tetrahydromethanopterin reductase-like flavin-dependent oxidoreductase (luciferase family)